MAERTTNQDLFLCPVCLDVLKDPVTLLCGHNYCMDCIKRCWNQEDAKGLYSCPQCRQTFSPRPVLNKNNVLAELSEHFRKTRIQAAPANCYVEQGEIGCDVCTGRKLKAVKSCLDCLLSYCEAHFKAHNDLNPGRKHNVVDATGQLQERICCQHEKPLEIFCRTDQNCICFLCMVDEHKSHDTISAAGEMKEKRSQVGEIQGRLHLKIQEREKELQELRKAVKTLKISAQRAVKDNERMSAEMIRSIERRHSEVTKLIRDQEEAEVSQAEGLLRQLEQEVAKLKRRDAELKQLVNTEDHIHFLKTFQSINVSSKISEDIPSIHVSEKVSFEAVTQSVSNLKKWLEDTWKEEAIKISASVAQVKAGFTEPTNREDLLKYFCELTLDANTAHHALDLSEGNKSVSYERCWSQSKPDHPDRFSEWKQVLCKEGVSERCYWEVGLSGGNGVVSIAVAYKSIGRKQGNRDCGFGFNDKSWSLENNFSVFRHNNEQTLLPYPGTCDRIGVYVDHKAGTLAFYNISGTKLTLLHRVQTSFTEVLYPGFRMYKGRSVKLV